MCAERVCGEAAAWQGDLQERNHQHLGDRRQPSQDLLSEPLSPSETVPRSQDSLLRRRAVPLLHPVRGGQARLSPSRLLLKGNDSSCHHRSHFQAFVLSIRYTL